MTAFVKRPFSALDSVMLAFRVVTLTILLCVFVPVVMMRAQDAQTAVNTEKIKALEMTNAALVKTNSDLQERVSRIEGVGIGLGALTAVQLFLQLGSHMGVRRKEK